MTHDDLVAIAASWLYTQASCSVVLTELRVKGLHEIPDAIGWRGPGDTVTIEVKVSRSDFLNDLTKRCRQTIDDGVGLTRYYLAPVGILRESEIPPKWGLLEFRNGDQDDDHGLVDAVKQPQDFPQTQHSNRAEKAMLLEALRLSQRAYRADLGDTSQFRKVKGANRLQLDRKNRDWLERVEQACPAEPVDAKYLVRAAGEHPYKDDRTARAAVLRAAKKQLISLKVDEQHAPALYSKGS